jgi:hypothetical protein
MTQSDLGNIDFIFILAGGKIGVSRKFYGWTTYEQLAYIKTCAPHYFDEIIHDSGICPDCNTHPDMPQA